LRIWLKNRVFFGWLKFVNAYVERGKKNFEKMDFWLKPLAQMIEIPRPIRLDSTSSPQVRSGQALLGTFALAAVCAFD